MGNFAITKLAQRLKKNCSFKGLEMTTKHDKILNSFQVLFRVGLSLLNISAQTTCDQLFLDFEIIDIIIAQKCFTNIYI